MAKNPGGSSSDGVSSTIDELLLSALERGDESLETGRYIITFKEGAVEEGIQALGTQGFNSADARDFENQALSLEDIADADAAVFPEIGSALVGAAALEEHGMSVQAEVATDSPFETIEPEYFAFAEQDVDYLRGFTRATEAIANDLNGGKDLDLIEDSDLETQVQVLGATWGLVGCKVPPSLRSGVGIKVAVLDTGMDLGHPDFMGRAMVGRSFVGQPVQDLHGHGTHCIGTACGPKAPPGTTPGTALVTGLRSSWARS
ncbi:subtilase family protein [Rhodococcus sp. MTM3W5.2]|nr:subtilase family protein [Rhodococcus sp. MTM3W5.2]